MAVRWPNSDTLEPFSIYWVSKSSAPMNGENIWFSATDVDISCINLDRLHIFSSRNEIFTIQFVFYESSSHYGTVLQIKILFRVGAWLIQYIFIFSIVYINIIQWFFIN